MRPAPGDCVEIDAYFADPPPPELTALVERDCDQHGAELVIHEALPPTDWLARYRESVVPFQVGKQFVVDPRDPCDEVLRAARDDGRFLLRIPARSAFGIGSHESTRLAVELLEAAPPQGLEVLDVGTGTGILALVALRLGARSAVGIDVDPGAALVARDTARRNALSPRLAAATIGALRPGAAFDVVVVNIIPAEWLGSAAELRPYLSTSAAVITSGLLVGQRAMVRDRLVDLGLELADERREGEWLALRFVRP